jgi:hypothetical protein
VQFRSKRLSGHMFKVTNGQVDEVKPVFGHSYIDHNGSIKTLKDKVIEGKETSAQMHPGTNRGLNPNGY